MAAARQPLEPQLGDDAVLAHQRHHVRERADGGDLDERRQPACASAVRAERLHQLQRDADAREVSCRDTWQSCRFGLITASAGGSVSLGLVMVRDDQIDAELRARRAASPLRMPQSTETMTRAPCACRRSIEAGCRP